MERSPEVLHAQGLAHLIASRAGGSLARAVAELEGAAERGTDNALLLSDLAAAYTIHAQRRGEPYDLVRALETVERALALDPSLREARFNRALLLEKLALRYTAQVAWKQYATMEPDSEWAREAISRAESLASPSWDERWQTDREQLEKAALTGDRRTVELITDRYRQPAREYAQEDLLPSWAEATASARQEDANRALRIARGIGEALTKLGGDSMIRDAVAVIEEAAVRPGSLTQMTALVDGHRAYRDGRRLYMNSQFGEAILFLKRSEAYLQQGGSPMAGWPALFAAVCVHFRPDYDQAQTLFAELSQDIEYQRYPAFTARLLYNLGLARAARGDFSGSLSAYLLALSFCERVKEVENLAAIHHVLAEDLDLLGKPEEGWRHRYQALRLLSSIPESTRYVSILKESAEALRHQENLPLSLYFLNELVRLSVKTGDPQAIAQAFLQRSQTHLQLGNRDAAGDDLQRVRQELDALDPSLRKIFEASLQLKKGALLRSSDPLTALREISEAIDFFIAAKARLPLIEAYLLRARIHSSLHDEASTESDLEKGIKEYESRREAIQGDDLRISYFDQSRDLFNEMIRFQIEVRQRPEAALDYLERIRARATLDQLAALPTVVQGKPAIRSAASRPWRWPEVRSEIPDDVAILEFAVIDQHILIWIMRSDGLDLVRRPLSPNWLDRSVKRHVGALQRRTGIENMREGSASLYDLLIRPVIPLVRGKSTLVLIPDGPLYSLPFASLLDIRRNRFLVEDFDLAVAPSATVFLECLYRNQVPEDGFSQILAIGDPAVSQSELANLTPLPHAAEEAKGIAALYPNSHLLLREAATAGRFLQLAPRSDVIHFAGHTLVNSDFPLYSALLLARAPGSLSSGDLFAHELYGERFEHTRVVVLASCSSARGGRGTSEGAIGLARPFIAGGVPAVITSHFQVEDSATSRLFTSFHRQLLAEGDPVKALANAQREAIRESVSTPNRAWTWAAFEVIGSGRKAN